jgi:malate dehydrogenase (quinone)
MFIPSSPPQVPHLDARKIGGKPVLLFGPFAGFSPRRMGAVFSLQKRLKRKKQSNGQK